VDMMYTFSSVGAQVIPIAEGPNPPPVLAVDFGGSVGLTKRFSHFTITI
jgi:hypothetical protein